MKQSGIPRLLEAAWAVAPSVHHLPRLGDGHSLRFGRQFGSDRAIGDERPRNTCVQHRAHGI